VVAALVWRCGCDRFAVGGDRVVVGDRGFNRRDRVVGRDRDRRCGEGNLIVRRSGGAARSVWPWLRQIAWLHFAGAAAGFSVASAVAQDFVSSHHDLMAATFSADGVVPSLSQVFHGRVLGAAVLVAAAAAAGLSLRLLRRVIGSTWRLLRSPVVR